MSRRNQVGELETAVQEALTLGHKNQNQRGRKQAPELRRLLHQVSEIMDDIGESMRENHERARDSQSETEQALHSGFQHIGYMRNPRKR